MSITPETRPSPHYGRVASWIYTVINPLIEALRGEAGQLDRGSISWRWYSRRCQYIHVIRAYVEPHYSPNFEDFLIENEEFVKRFDKHDAALRKTEQQAAKFYDLLLAAAIFKEQVNQAFREFESARTLSQSVAPDLDSLRKDLSEYVAEYIVNNIDSLPAHYTTSEFWNRFGQRFLKGMQEFEGSEERQAFTMLNEAKRELREASERLLHDLKDYRTRLCRDFDLPAAEPLPPGFPKEDLRRYR
jgi:hypothetical protein